MTYIWIMGVSLLGSLIQGITGFGYAIICIPLWSLLIPFKMTVIVETISALVMSCGIAFKLRKHVNLKLMIVPFLSSIAGSTIGISLLMKQEDMAMRKILGCVLIFLSIYFIFYSDKIHIQPTLLNSAIFGCISGICGGLLGVGGPALVMYYLSATKDKMEYHGTLQANFTLITIYTFIVHLLYGNITWQVIQCSILSIAALLLGTSIGLRIFYKLSQDKLDKLVYGFMVIMGISLLF